MKHLLEAVHRYQSSLLSVRADISLAVLASQRSSKPDSRLLITTFSGFLRLINITRCHYELC